MTSPVTDAQRRQVRDALFEVGVKLCTVDEIDDEDIDKLHNNNWRKMGHVLNAQREDLVDVGVSRGMVSRVSRVSRGMVGCLKGDGGYYRELKAR